MSSLKSDYFFIDSLKKVKQEDWNACVDDDHPFIQYEFLFALEESESACSQTGWKPYHYICLLYTSPSPRDGLLSRMPSSA